MVPVFEPQTSLLDIFNMPYGQVARFFTADEQWRKDLQKGDRVDINLRADERSRLRGWMQATVVDTFEEDPDSLMVKCLEATTYYDVKCSRFDLLLQPFGSKTADDYKWRNEVLVGSTELRIKIHDKTSWHDGFIRDFKMTEHQPGRKVLMAYCALRVYRSDLPDSHPRRDERGPYIGYSDKFDEWVPVFTPRIVPFDSQVQDKPTHFEVDDSMDEKVTGFKEHKKAYVVPRSYHCISELYLHYVNTFGNLGCFEEILKIIKDTPEVTKPEDLITLSCLLQILCKPWALYHSSFIGSVGKDMIESVKEKLFSATDSAMRDIRKEQVDATIQCINNFNKRLVQDPIERVKEAEVLKLQFCKKSLASTLLERRIQGIRDLQDIVKTCQTSETFSSEYLITWMEQNQVFEQIWDPKKTHAQILQRSSEIFKLLVKED